MTSRLFLSLVRLGLTVAFTDLYRTVPPELMVSESGMFLPFSSTCLTIVATVTEASCAASTGVPRVYAHQRGNNAHSAHGWALGYPGLHKIS